MVADGNAAAMSSGEEGLALTTENSILESATPGQPARDLLRLPGPDAPGGAYPAWIRSNGVARTAIDRAGLLLVDHDPSLRALPVGGQVVLGTVEPPARVNTDGGVDVTAQLGAGSGDPVLGALDQSMTMEFAAKGGNGFLVLNAAREGPSGLVNQCGIAVDVPDGAGWRQVAQLYPRRELDELVADIGAATRVRLRFVSDARLRSVGRLVPSSEPPALTWATLEKAAKGGGGDLTSALNAVDGASAALTGQDTIRLSFAVPAQTAGKARDCFLWVEATPPGGRAAGGLAQRPQAESPALRFALYPAWPNPFTQRIVVRFELAAAGPAKLELFDLQGRRVRALHEGALAVGDHSVEWDGRDEAGAQLGRGTYFLRLTAGSLQQQRKITLVR